MKRDPLWIVLWISASLAALSYLVAAIANLIGLYLRTRP